MKKLLFVIVTCCTIFSIGQVAADSFDVSAEHAIAVEVSTGKILYEKDATTSAGIASITKMLTVYMVYKEVEAGRLSWDTLVDISDYPYNLTVVSEVSNLPMEERQYTVQDLVNASLIASANSAAIALAEKIGGSEPEFVDMMTEQLETWGITDAKLVNASGLNNSYLGDNIYPGTSSSDENMMSAQDVAIIARHLITDYPEVLDITSLATDDFAGTQMTNYNLMLEGMSMEREGVDGLKTGTTELAGPCFVATSTENDMRVITVVLNAQGDDDTARFSATSDLLDYIGTNYQLTTLVKKGQSYQDSQVTVQDGKSDSVQAVAAEDLTVVTLQDDSGSAQFSALKDIYTAPLAKGDTLGSITYLDTNLIGEGYLDEAPSVKAVAKSEVKSSFFLKVWWNRFVRYVNNKL